MRKAIQIIFLVAVIISSTNLVAFAYPTTLDNGNLVLIDGGMGVGRYANRDSVSVEIYKPPFYQIAINIIPVTFSEEYFKNQNNYTSDMYRIGSPYTLHFRYHWERKSLSFQRNGTWMDWDINRDYSHAEGNPLIPYAAEVAFVSAYNMKFFGDKTGYSPFLKKQYRIIDDNLYRTLGI